MRKHQLFTATVLPLLFTGACAMPDSDQTNDPVLGECGDSHCDDGGGGGSGSGSDDGGCHDSSCDGDSGGGGGGGDVDVDVDVDLDVEAELELKIIGSGVYIGLFPLGCLDISGDFYADAHATATLNDDLFVLADVQAAASIDLGNGCSCSGINLNAIAAIEVDASIHASVDSCKHACNGHGSSCESACNQPGNVIKAHASLDANACAAVDVSVGGALDLSALVGVNVDLELDAVVDAHGAIVVNL